MICRRARGAPCRRPRRRLGARPRPRRGSRLPPTTRYLNSRLWFKKTRIEGLSSFLRLSDLGNDREWFWRESPPRNCDARVRALGRSCPRAQRPVSHPLCCQVQVGERTLVSAVGPLRASSRAQRAGRNELRERLGRQPPAREPRRRRRDDRLRERTRETPSKHRACRLRVAGLVWGGGRREREF